MSKIKLILGVLILAVVSILSFAEAGLENPPGEFVNPGTMLSVSPTSFTVLSTQTNIQLSLTMTDAYVYKDLYLCKAPCRTLIDWKILGEIQSPYRSGNYADGRNGITKQFTIIRSELNSGNNFVAAYTCKGYNNCNNKRWVKQKFTVTFS